MNETQRSILKTEVTTDPLARGYSGMTNIQVANNLNVKNRDKNKTRMEATEVVNAVLKSEYNALDTTSKSLFWDIIHIGDINPFGVEADLFVDMFGAGSTTVSTLQTLRKTQISRAEELGLPVIWEGHIEEARK